MAVPIFGHAGVGVDEKKRRASGQIADTGQDHEWPITQHIREPAPSDSVYSPGMGHRFSPQRMNRFTMGPFAAVPIRVNPSLVQSRTAESECWSISRNTGSADLSPSSTVGHGGSDMVTKFPIHSTQEERDAEYQRDSLVQQEPIGPPPEDSTRYASRQGAILSAHQLVGLLW